MVENVIRLERVIAASPQQVYRAWLEPELVRQWMAPGHFETVKAEIDERPGGHYRIWQVSGGASVGGFESRILELDPSRRIVWQWGFVGPQRSEGPVYDSVLTVTLRETPEGTTVLTLVHERLDDLVAAMPEVGEKVSAGWDNILGKLAVLVESATPVVTDE
jgi:uncharacterized protein YndB with AHSA1/START domain